MSGLRFLGWLLLALAVSPLVMLGIAQFFEMFGCEGGFNGKRGANPYCSFGSWAERPYQFVTDFWVIAAMLPVISVPVMLVLAAAGAAVLRETRRDGGS